MVVNISKVDNICILVVQEVTVMLENPTDSEITMSGQLTNPRNFTLQPQTVVIGAYDHKEVCYIGSKYI